MQMLYNSDSYTVVQFSVPGADDPSASLRGGFEIVDKSARKGIYLEGALADSFQRGVRELASKGPDVEAMDDYIGGFTALARQPLVLH